MNNDRHGTKLPDIIVNYGVSEKSLDNFFLLFIYFFFLSFSFFTFFLHIFFPLALTFTFPSKQFETVCQPVARMLIPDRVNFASLLCPLFDHSTILFFSPPFLFLISFHRNFLKALFFCFFPPIHTFVSIYSFLIFRNLDESLWILRNRMKYVG